MNSNACSGLEYHPCQRGLKASIQWKIRITDWQQDFCLLLRGVPTSEVLDI